MRIEYMTAAIAIVADRLRPATQWTSALPLPPAIRHGCKKFKQRERCERSSG